MKALIVSAILLLAPGAVLAAEGPITEARQLAELKRYDDAVAVLNAAKAQRPDDAELRLTLARVLSWKGDYRAASAELAGLPGAEAATIRGNLAYYQSDFATAQARYTEALTIAPEFDEARDGLTRVAAARAAEGPKWQVDAGTEYSGFSGSDQPDWNQQSVQITRRFNANRSAAHLRLVRYSQFGLNDGEVELGLAGRLGDRVSVYASLAGSPDADFRPEGRMAAGGAVRMTKSVWLTFDGRRDRYAAARVTSAAWGMRYEPHDGWALSSRMIRVSPSDSDAQTGYDLRLDGTIREGLRFYAGLADAPETVAAVTIDTRSAFAGIAWDMTQITTLRAGYGRDDRENTYVRHGFHVTVSHRF
ncbi:tetratricopeptide repeat family protein [Asticcacaulis biprosthecium C19]|uniref:Tetratricopeptide repeat family protein n=1 Tax=Asticcacaulis biprosthecium C19 TaxID=715226 RepID=F4QI28_9CAUL|nr:YaiO family outer membrane beta-barrel protein [Asticcacaulis biprosthecium]EGF92895.1 tetratricopeptide repeat family protein [Asticcacaulis biprosthecium C19]